MRNDFSSTQELVNHLSNYNGANASYEDALAGEGNPLLDFNSFRGDNQRVNFRNEMATNRSFRFTIQNPNATVEAVRLLPGFNPSNANKANDGAFLSVGGNNLTLLNTDPQPVKLLQSQLAETPIKCLGFKAESDSILIRSSKIEIIEWDAFSPTPKKTVINFADYTDEYVQQEKTITVRTNFFLTARTEIILYVPAYLGVGVSSNTTLSLWFGASLDLGAAIQKMNNMALPVVGK